MGLNEVIGSLIGGFNHLASGIDIMSLENVSCRLEHAGPPQEDR